MDWVMKFGSILATPLLVFMSTGMRLTKKVRLSGLRVNTFVGIEV